MTDGAPAPAPTSPVRPGAAGETIREGGAADTVTARVLAALDARAGAATAAAPADAVIDLRTGSRTSADGLAAAVRARVVELGSDLPAGGVVALEPAPDGGPAQESPAVLVDLLALAALGAVALVRDPRLPLPAWDRLVHAASPGHRLSPGCAPARTGGGPRPATTLHPRAYQLVATSGSSGRPKLVQLTHDGTLGAAQAYRHRLSLAPGACVAVPQSLASVGALPSGYLPALLGGGTAVMAPAVGVRTFLDGLAELGVAYVMAVTGWWQACLRAPSWPGLPHLAVLGIGGSPWEHLLPALRDRVPAATVLGNYGMSETHGPGLHTLVPPGTSPAAPGGVPVAGLTVQVRPAGNPAAQDGEVWVRGPLVTPGYAGGEAMPVDEAGWMSTGDCGEVLPDGSIRVLGRRDDQVNDGGRKVYPAEVEAELTRMAGVAGCAVVTVAGPTGGCLAAFVVTGAGAPSDAEIRRRIRERLGSHAVPASVHRVPGIPLTPTRKTDTAALREMAAGQPAADRSRRPAPPV